MFTLFFIKESTCTSNSYALDIDECQQVGIECFQPNSADLLASVSACRNTAGGYECTCNDGYSSVDGKT